MKIAVNVRFLLKDKLEGIGTFTFETLKRICTKYEEHEFYFIFDRSFNKEYIFSKNITPIVIPPQSRHPVLWYLWFEWSIPYILKRIKPDIFVSMDGYLSTRINLKSLAVIHDIAFEHYPMDIPKSVMKFYKQYFPIYANKASRIATVSNFSKKDISKHYQIDPGKIDVVFNGAGENFKPLNEAEKLLTRRRLTNNMNYFVYVGAIHHRKNITNLLKAFDKFRNISNHEFKLVIIGQKSAWAPKEISRFYETMKYKHDVKFTGRVSDSDLEKYLASAYALVNISYFEGFGIPLLEAMYCDVPVIAANKTSFPEVMGNAGILVDPFNIDEIAIAMKTLAEDEKLRKKLIQRSQQQRLNYSWDKTAELLWKSIVGVCE